MSNISTLVTRLILGQYIIGRSDHSVVLFEVFLLVGASFRFQREAMNFIV